MDFPVIVKECSLFLFDGDTGPIAHVLPGAGYGVEQRRLAGVRVAGQGHSNCATHCRAQAARSGSFIRMSAA